MRAAKSISFQRADATSSRARAGQQEQLRERAERPAGPLESAPDQPDFLIVQGAGAAALFRWGLDPLAGRQRNQVVIVSGPVEKLPQGAVVKRRQTGFRGCCGRK
jgi:hypothetical protein